MIQCTLILFATMIQITEKARYHETRHGGGQNELARNVKSVTRSSDSGDRNNLALPIFEYDQFTVQLLTSIEAYYVRGINGVRLDLSLFHERTPQDYIKVRLFRQIDHMCGFSLANGDWQLSDTYNATKKSTMNSMDRTNTKKTHLTSPLYP